MCDTVILMDSSGKPAFFGKNSDRHPEEPQALLYISEREPSAARLREGVEYQDKGFAMLLSKPSWMAGGEMGVNNQGLSIGNEAVFSRFKPDEHGILGMDILRAALSACANAKEARDFITSFIEKYGQGGNGAYKGRLVYNNSFLAADPQEAYIIETAGTRWAWRSAMAADAISNTYCIEDDYKRLDMQTRKEIAPVNERAACSDESDPGRKGKRNSWKAHVEDRRYLFFTKGEQRRSSSLGGLMRIVAEGAGSRQTEAQNEVQSEPKAQLEKIFSLLRSHEGAPKPGPFLSRMKNLCVHPGLFPQSATTGSMVVEYLPGGALVWHTDSSYPCVSLYKPVLLKDGRFYSLWKPLCEENKAEERYASWNSHRQWAVTSGHLQLSAKEEFAQSRDAAQASIIRIARQAFDSVSREKGTAERIISVYANEVAAIVGEWEKRWRN